MELGDIFQIFERHGFPFEVDGELIQYIFELLIDNSHITPSDIQEKHDIILSMLTSSYGEDIEDIIRVILNDLMNCCSKKQKNMKQVQKKADNRNLQKNASLVTSPAEKEKEKEGNRKSELQPIKKDESLIRSSRVSDMIPSQSYYQPAKRMEQESGKLHSLKSILRSNNVPVDNVDETIAEYLNEICSDEMMSFEELQEIILTYFPSLDGKSDVSRNIILSIISSQTSKSLPSDQLSSTTNHHTGDASVMAADGDNDDEDGIESKSNDSELDEDFENEDSELTMVNVDDIQEIFPTISRLCLQYVYHIKCFDNYADTCQYLLDHQTGTGKISDARIIASVDLELEELNCHAQQYHEKSLQKLQNKQRESDNLKKKIFDQYGDQVIHQPNDGKRRKKKDSEAEKMKVLSLIGTQSNQRVRYRDNKIASTRGEKIIIEKNPQDDYDGGSRGRVKTKGKRGPGFVMS